MILCLRRCWAPLARCYASAQLRNARHAPICLRPFTANHLVRSSHLQTPAENVKTPDSLQKQCEDTTGLKSSPPLSNSHSHESNEEQDGGSRNSVEGSTEPHIEEQARLPEDNEPRPLVDERAEPPVVGETMPPADIETEPPTDSEMELPAGTRLPADGESELLVDSEMESPVDSENDLPADSATEPPVGSEKELPIINGSDGGAAALDDLESPAKIDDDQIGSTDGDSVEDVDAEYPFAEDEELFAGDEEESLVENGPEVSASNQSQIPSSESAGTVEVRRCVPRSSPGFSRLASAIEDFDSTRPAYNDEFVTEDVLVQKLVAHVERHVSTTPSQQRRERELRFQRRMAARGKKIDALRWIETELKKSIVERENALGEFRRRLRLERYRQSSSPAAATDSKYTLGVLMPSRTAVPELSWASVERDEQHRLQRLWSQLLAPTHSEAVWRLNALSIHRAAAEDPNTLRIYTDGTYRDKLGSGAAAVELSNCHIRLKRPIINRVGQDASGEDVSGLSAETEAVILALKTAEEFARPGQTVVIFTDSRYHAAVSEEKGRSLDSASDVMDPLIASMTKRLVRLRERKIRVETSWISRDSMSLGNLAAHKACREAAAMLKPGQEKVVTDGGKPDTVLEYSVAETSTVRASGD